jgi:hypothetical protein
MLPLGCLPLLGERGLPSWLQQRISELPEKEDFNKTESLVHTQGTPCVRPGPRSASRMFMEPFQKEKMMDQISRGDLFCSGTLCCH